MKVFDRITTVMVMGSIWGAFEIFGALGLREIGIVHRSPFLFAFALAIMMAAKRMSGFAGSAFIMSIIAALYKTLSLDLHACGAVSVMAVLIDGAVFEIFYASTQNSFESSIWRRSLWAPAITATVFIPFAFYAAYIGGEALYGFAGLGGIWALLKTSGLQAAIASIPAIHIGYYLGEALKGRRPLGRISVRYAQVIGLLIMAAAWIARVTV